MYYDARRRAEFEAKLSRVRRSAMDAANVAADAGDESAATDLTEIASHAAAMLHRSLTDGRGTMALHSAHSSRDSR